jgi:LPS-assembly protein
MLAVVPATARAQDASAAEPPAADEQIVEFSADQLIYDSEADLVTASGAVRMNRDGT